MKKIIVAVAISAAALVGCTNGSGPVPTVTVTERNPDFNNNVPDSQSSESEYLAFVKNNGGLYVSYADDRTLLDMGLTVCNGYSSGLSQQDIVNALSQALIENGMNNEEGARFAAAIIVGAEKYLCSGGQV